MDYFVLKACLLKSLSLVPQCQPLYLLHFPETHPHPSASVHLLLILSAVRMRLSVSWHLPSTKKGKCVHTGSQMLLIIAIYKGDQSCACHSLETSFCMLNSVYFSIITSFYFV